MEPNSGEHMHVTRYPIRFDNNTQPVQRTHIEREPILQDDLEESHDERTESQQNTSIIQNNITQTLNQKTIKRFGIILIICLILLIIISAAQIGFFYNEPTVIFGGVILLLFVCTFALALFRRSIILSSASLGFLLFTVIYDAFVAGLIWSDKLTIVITLICSLIVEILCFGVGVLYIRALHKHLQAQINQTLSFRQQPTPLEQQSPDDVEMPHNLSSSSVRTETYEPVAQVSLVHNPHFEVRPIPTITVSPQQPTPVTPLSPQDRYKSQLLILHDMGFTNESLNIEKLIKHNGHLTNVVNEHLSALTKK